MNANSATPVPQQAQPTFNAGQAPYSKLIRAEVIPGLSFLNAETKVTYANGVNKLWRAIQSKPATDPEHQEAVRKLQELTQSIMSSLNQMKASMVKQQSTAVQQAAQRSQAQGQPQVSTPQPLNSAQAQNSQAQARPALTQASNVLNPQQQQALHASVKARVDAFQWTLPPNVVDGGPEAEQWRVEARRRYTTWLFNQELARVQMAKFDSHITQLRQAGKEVSDEITDQKTKAETQYQQNKSLIENLMRSQSQSRDQAARSGVVAGTSVPPQPVQGGGGVAGATGQIPRVPVAPNPAVDAVRQNNTPSTSPASGQLPNGSASFQMNHSQPNMPHAQQSIFGGGQTRPLPTPNQPYPQAQVPAPTSGIPGASGGPTPFFSHQAAVAAAARTYSHNQTPGQGMASSMNGHSFPRPSSEKRQQDPLPISKTFVPQPPQPVAMGPSRPTLPGSTNGQVGMMGQPAIQKAPTYMLQGTGDHVLDKKKLDELVRQVTGGSGEGLQPDVEEVRSHPKCVT